MSDVLLKSANKSWSVRGVEGTVITCILVSFIINHTISQHRNYYSTHLARSLSLWDGKEDGKIIEAANNFSCRVLAWPGPP